MMTIVITIITITTKFTPTNNNNINKLPTVYNHGRRRTFSSETHFSPLLKMNGCLQNKSKYKNSSAKTFNNYVLIALHFQVI